MPCGGTNSDNHCWCKLNVKNNTLNMYQVFIPEQVHTVVIGLHFTFLF